MQRKRGELVPIGEVLSGLDDVPAIRDASPQARHCLHPRRSSKPSLSAPAKRTRREALWRG